jgi:phage baseplate assembly protein W
VSDDFRDYGTDFRLIFGADGRADIAWDGEDVDIVAGLDNLAQALTMRLLVQRGELTELAHPRYGSRVHELIGATIDRANLDLLRRHVRRALLGDPRVEKVLSVTARPLPAHPGAVQVTATVKARAGEITSVEVALDLS